MADGTPSKSPREAASGGVGHHATDAFELLGNETRLAILLALWEAYVPHSEGNGVPFSDLRERVGIRDSGQFNYHLGKLEGRFIKKSENGYELRRSGRKLVQSIISGTGIEEPTLEPTEIDVPCPECGAPTAITYENVFAYQVCTECPGFGDPRDEHPAGVLVAWTFEPTGLSSRSAEEVFTASTIKNFGRIAMRFEEICPDCSGPVEWSLDICENHEVVSGQRCPNCGRSNAILVRETCTVCKSAGHGSPGIKVLLHPAVISFYYEHGVEIGFTGSLDFEDISRILALVKEFEEEVLSTDPPRIRVTASHEGDELHLTLDQDMNVIEVSGNS